MRFVRFSSCVCGQKLTFPRFYFFFFVIHQLLLCAICQSLVSHFLYLSRSRPFHSTFHFDCIVLVSSRDSSNKATFSGHEFGWIKSKSINQFENNKTEYAKWVRNKNTFAKIYLGHWCARELLVPVVVVLRLVFIDELPCVRASICHHLCARSIYM